MTSRIRDIGMEGMFIETGFLTPVFGKNAVLEAEFSLGQGAAGRRYRMKAFVRHRAADGIGVMFCVLDQALYRDLRKMLYGSSETRALCKPPAQAM